jgi:uncharacterized protein involved in exopolysaccharide biosynthesis
MWALAAVVLAAVIVTAASLYQTPKYEASAKVLVSVRYKQCSQQICLIPNAPVTLPTQLAAQTVRIDSPSVAKEAIRRLGGLQGTSPDQLLDNLTVIQRDELFIQLSYRDTDPKRAKVIVGTVGRAAAERITGTSPGMLGDTELTATVWDVKAPREPVSPSP